MNSAKPRFEAAYNWCHLWWISLNLSLRLRTIEANFDEYHWTSHWVCVQLMPPLINNAEPCSEAAYSWHHLWWLAMNFALEIHTIDAIFDEPHLHAASLWGCVQFTPPFTDNLEPQSEAAYNWHHLWWTNLNLALTLCTIDTIFDEYRWSSHWGSIQLMPSSMNHAEPRSEVAYNWRHLW